VLEGHGRRGGPRDRDSSTHALAELASVDRGERAGTPEILRNSGGDRWSYGGGAARRDPCRFNDLAREGRPARAVAPRVLSGALDDRCRNHAARRRARAPRRPGHHSESANANHVFVEAG